MDMELLQLRYFRALAREEHMSRTAEKLYISQPSLSATIKKLETELGVPLFDRTGRNIQLNRYGKRFLRCVDSVFASLDEGVAELRNMRGHYENQVLIGIQTPYVWQDLTQNFLGTCPGVTIGQRSIENSDYIDQLLREEIDFHIGTLGDGEKSGKESQLESVEFAHGDVYVVVHPKSPLASKAAVSMIELRDEYIISRNRSDNFQQYTDRLCREAGFEPRIAMECDYTLREQMVAQGYGISFSTEHALRWLDRDDVVPVRIGDPGIFRRYQLIWKKSRPFTPAMQNFYDFTISYILKK